MNELVVFEYLVYTLNFQKLSRTFHVIISENSPILGGAWWMLNGRQERAVGKDAWVIVRWTRGRLLQDPGNPCLSQLLKVGCERGGWGCCCCSLPGRQDLLDPGFAPVKIIFLSCFHTPSPCGPDCALGCFDCISTVFTVIFGEIFNLVCCLFMVLFL